MTTNETSIVVSREINATAKEIFDLLTLPERHREFDGSGMVRADEKSQRIQAVGDVFVMNMHAEFQGGDYVMHNHVTAYDENKMVGWQPATDEEPKDPKGWEWLYTLEAGADGQSTTVTLTYSWDKVTDNDLISIFPAVSEKDLEESLNLLAGAVN